LVVGNNAYYLYRNAMFILLKGNCQMKKWLKEPLLHFLIIGALIFIVFSVINKEEISLKVTG